MTASVHKKFINACKTVFMKIFNRKIHLFTPVCIYAQVQVPVRYKYIKKKLKNTHN